MPRPLPPDELQAIDASPEVAPTGRYRPNRPFADHPTTANLAPGSAYLRRADGHSHNVAARALM